MEFFENNDFEKYSYTTYWNMRVELRHLESLYGFAIQEYLVTTFKEINVLFYTIELYFLKS